MTDALMGLDRTHPRMLSIEALLDGVKRGSVVLPDFQRDFDWTEADVRSLMVTVLSGWPAGSLLLMTGERPYFRVRGFEGGPDPSSDLQFVVLDGQQRLTALYHAFRNAGPSVYAVDWSKVGTASVDALEDAVLSFRRSDWAEAFGTPESQLAATLVPLFALSSASDYFSWRDAVVAVAPADARAQLGRELSDLYRRVFSNAQSYEFPAIVVTSKIAPGAIARIFERLNRTGQPLNAFDLMVAISYEPTWNLRDHWEELRRGSTAIDSFLGEDGLPVLQVIALRTQRNIREQAVLGLDGSIVRQEWDRAAAAMEDALLFLAELGVGNPSWLPYRTMCVVLAGLAASLELRAHRPRLEGWFWSTAFGEAYDVASNTRAVADYGALSRGDAVSVLIDRSTVERSTRRRNAAIWRAFMCAMSANHATDLASGIRLGVADTLSETVVQALLPKLDRGDGDVSPHLKVMNLVLAARGTAKRVRTRGVLDAIRDVPPDLLEERLTSQFLPGVEAFEDLLVMWPSFLPARAEALSVFLAAKGVEFKPEPETTIV